MEKTRLPHRLGLLMAICLLANAIDLLAVPSPDAQTQGEKPLHFFLGGAVTFGGDKLATIYLTNGNEQNIRAGSLLEIKGGIDFRIIPRVSLRGSIGYHFDQESASSSGGADGNINFFRFPLEGMLFWHVNDELRVGAGVRKAFGATLEGTDGLAYFGSYTLESSLGIVVEAEYQIGSVGLFLRYVTEKYRLNSYSLWNGGGHVGLGVNYYF